MMKKLYTIAVLLVLCLGLKAQPCSDLFISEYIEGASFNKVIEIFNPTSGTILLDGYVLQLYSNGSDTPSFHFNLHGTLLSNDVYVIANSQADSNFILPLADTTSLVCNWNGDDAVALINSNTGDTLDIIGVIGQDPGSSWPVTLGSTQDHVLVRADTVQEGTTDWSLSATQWIAYADSDFSHIGSHTMIPCSAISPSVYFFDNTLSFSENYGSFSVQIGITNPNGNPTHVDVSAMDITAFNGTDYTFPVLQTVTFPPNSSTPVTVSGTIVNDAVSETDEVFQLQLTNATNQASITSDVVKITIVDDDGLGVSTLQDEAMKIYPTVSTGMFTIESSEAVHISISDEWGNEFFKADHPGGTMKIDLLNKSRGICFIRMESNRMSLVKKVIVQ